MNHTTQRQHELETRYQQLSNLIAALNIDLSRTNPEHEKLPLREKLVDAQREREEVAAQLDALARGMPVESAAGGLFDSPRYAAQRQAYLAALAERYNWVSTAAFTEQAGPEQTGKAHRLPLLDSAEQTGVYVPLLFEPAGGSRPRPKERGREQEEEMAQASRLHLAQVLAQPGHLAIVGAAGSGKTTLLRIVMALLTDPDPAGVAPELAAVLPQPRPLPVFLPLRLFEFACARPDASYQRTQASLLRFLNDWFCQGCSDLELPERFLAEHVLAGRAWLLLDALDEVADPDHRRTIRNVIKNDLLAACKTSRIVVTTRVAGYRDAPLDNRFHVVQVAPLDAEQRAMMVRKLYRGLALADHERRGSELLQRMETRPDLAFLTTTPVMVWTAAVIHAFRGNLPDGRAALYDAYLDILLRKSFDLGEFEVEALTQLEGRWNLQDRKQGLSYGAFAAHRWLEDPERRAGASDEARSAPVITVRDLADDFLAGYFQSQAWAADAREARQQAREFAALMAERSGILIEEADGFRFGDHLTMQEFLAGRYLGEYYRQDDPTGHMDFVSEKHGAAWWREVFLLAIGYLAAKGGRDGLDLLRLLARQGAAPAQRLAALEVAGSACAQLTVLQAPPRWYEQARAELAGQLYDALWGAPLAAPILARHLAGLALGRLWGWESDPRFQV
ncbi:MAG TPA: NACHT domain-containing protein, partial [Anaerolineae bacterium]|nr:NACHT domain-containing protein [Anaerolineae bacterium]